MTIPAFLDPAIYPFSTVTVTGLTDVETGGVGIISSMRTLLVTGLGWSEPSTALFKTPVDSAGRFLDVLLTRISATVIEWRVRDQNASTICTRRFNLGGGQLFIHGSTVGVYAEFLQVGQNAAHRGTAFILDTAPDLNSEQANYVIGNAFLTNTGSNDGAGDCYGEFFAIDNGGASSANRTRYNRDSATNAMAALTASGKWRFTDCPILINFGGIWKWAGRVPHMLLCDQNFNGGDQRNIYIDTNTVATFRATSDAAVQDNVRAMLRIS